MNKICVKCKVEKDIEEFHKSSKSLDKRNNTCIKCRREIGLRSYYKKFDSVRIKKANNKRKKEKSKWYYEDKKSNPKKYKEKWDEQNNKRIEIKSNWTKQNRTRINKRLHERRSISVRLRIDQSIAGGIRNSITNKNGRKWEILVGYTLEELMDHLIKTIPEGYLLEDYGEKLHIDHIIQMINFKYSSCEDKEFKKCWNYRNLRFLESRKNMSRNDKIDKELVIKYGISDLLPEGIKLEDL